MQVPNPRLGIRDVSNGIIRVVARKWYASARVVDPRVALNFWLIMQPNCTSTMEGEYCCIFVVLPHPVIFSPLLRSISSIFISLSFSLFFFNI